MSDETVDVVYVEAGPCSGEVGDVIGTCFCYGSVPEDRTAGYIVRIHSTTEIWAIPQPMCRSAVQFYNAQVNVETPGIVFSDHKQAAAFTREVNAAIKTALIRHWPKDDSSAFGGSELGIKVYNKWL